MSIEDRDYYRERTKRRIDRELQHLHIPPQRSGAAIQLGFWIVLTGVLYAIFKLAAH